VKLVPEAVAGGAASLDLWHRTHQLRHSNLIELFDYGRAEHRGEIVLYAVFESPDDSLTTALSRGPLDREESREVLDSVLDALRYLHAQGLVLGALDAGHIVAVRDRIKLSTHALRDADTASAYREDVRLLGDLWQQALLAASPNSPEIAAHAADANPETRWSLAEISAALSPPVATVAAPAPPLTVSSPITVPQVSVPAVVVRNDPPALPPSHGRTPERATAHPFPKWTLVGAAGVVLLILGLSRPRPAVVATQSRVASVPLPVETPVSAPLPEAAVPEAAVPEAAVPTVPKASPAAGTEMWRVIAFTYRTSVAAAKKVEQLNQYHPGLNAAMFSPAKSGYYLVSLGGRMTHEEAVRVQRSARGKGLPRDLYVQNYSE
jgi:hypothetical protein